MLEGRCADQMYIKTVNSVQHFVSPRTLVIGKWYILISLPMALYPSRRS
jgi:hypothetical protein